MSGLSIGSVIVLGQSSRLTLAAPLSMLALLMTTLVAGRLWGLKSGMVHGIAATAVVASAVWGWNQRPIVANRHEFVMLVVLVVSVAWLGAIGRRAHRLCASSIHLNR